MSGHSKWANIKRRKEAVDAKKGKVFGRLAREIIIAAREGGDDLSMNATLRSIVDKAKTENMPKANIDRAIAKGAGKLPGVQVTEALYEGYGPEGVAFLIKCLTDNKNRTVSEIRSVFNRNGGSLADIGSVAYIFANSPDHPAFTIPLSDSGRQKYENLLSDLEELDDVVNIYSNVK